MRYFILLVIIFQFACGSAPKEKSVHSMASGNWFILYPAEELENAKQNKIYAAIQDSLVGLKCLKLITLSETGAFKQLDSINIKGHWGTKENSDVRIIDGGKGFDNFKTTFSGFNNDVMKLTEIVETDGEKLKLVWHLLKINDGDAAKLFDEEQNKWRIKAQVEESDEAIKNRVVQVVDYYSNYFKLISEKSSYFIPLRIILPFNFYQHAIGMKYFGEKSAFSSLFYSAEQAKKAHILLEEKLRDLEFEKTSDNSFTTEYAINLKKLARELEK